ncbi:MAG: hypothetical protein ACJ757_12800 [Gaiellaceae bacterium]
MSLVGFLDQWLVHVRARVRSVTMRGYESLLRCHVVPAVGDVALAEVSPLRLQRLYGQLLAGVGGRRLS